MTAQMLLFVVLCVLAAVWIVYGLLKAVNGIVYEIGVLRRFLETEE